MQVRFSYQALTAGDYEVGIAGDFTHWKILPLKEHAGLYIYDCELDPGRYSYKFIVDGVWQIDPSNPHTESDPYGGQNSVLTVQQDLSPQSIKEVIARVKQREAGDLIRIYRYSQQEVELRFLWYPKLADSVTIHIENKDLPLYPVGSGDQYYVWHRNLSAAKPSAFNLSISYKEQLLFLGEKGISETAEKAGFFELDPEEHPVFAVPDWLSSGTIYQIFMDRFCNGDPSRNQDFQEPYYDGCRQKPAEGTLLKKHEEYYHFEADWYDIAGLKQSPYLPKGKPDWWSFYGGDIPGVLSKLDYITDLGINIIYFNPLWEAKSVHKYDAADFRKVDPHFGTQEELKNLVFQAHKRGIRVILDVAFNHSGESFWAFRDTVKKGERSPYWHWYDWHKWPLPDPLPEDFQPKEYYQCWWGIKDMPDLNFDLSRRHPYENYIRNIKHAEVNWDLVNHILDAASWWISEIDIDGFRLDVPDEVPWWFWQLFRKRIKELKPDAWLVGELWHNAKDWIDPRYFDSVMNYPFFKNPVLEYFVQGLIPKQEYIRRIEEGLAAYPVHACKAQMNLLGSHDTQRILHIAKGKIQRVKLAIFFQMTFVGIPHIYYGDEIAMTGGKDPDNRRPFNWRWEQDPQAVDLRRFYQDLIRIRQQEELLREGEFLFVKVQNELVAYKRYSESDSITCLINPSQDTQQIQMQGEIIFSEGDLTHDAQGMLALPPLSMCMLKSAKR